MKLTLDEKDMLHDLIGHDGFKAFFKEAERLVELSEQRVLKYSLEGGSERELAFIKARAEGARKLLVELRSHMEALRARKDS